MQYVVHVSGHLLIRHGSTISRVITLPKRTNLPTQAQKIKIRLNWQPGESRKRHGNIYRTWIDLSMKTVRT